MSSLSCSTIDPLVTPYVDGALDGADRERVEDHLARCAACADRVIAERAVAHLCHERRPDLRGHAPVGLRSRCQSLARNASVRPSASTNLWRGRAWPMAAAAVLLVGVGWFGTMTSTQVIAAELAADHLKCMLMNAVLGTRQSEQEVQSAVRRRFAWDVELPRHPEQAGLTLVGSRPCLYQHGAIAHIMYRHNGVLASVYMLPGIRRSASEVRALGHHATMWSTDDRTFVVLERSGAAEVEQVASVVRASLK